MPEFSLMLVLWIALLILFVVVEAVTAQLTTIWFAVGAVAALISYLLYAPIWLQWVVFAAVSLVALVATRPLVKKIITKKKEHTNADMVIGKQGIVCEDIDNQNAKGAVKVNGNIWSARSHSGELIEKGSTVVILKIDGVKLIVYKI